MKHAFTKQQSILLFGLWLAFLISFVARLSWSSIMPQANAALGFSSFEGTRLISAFYLGYVLTVLPGGMLADRFGYKRVLTGSLLGLSIFSAAMSLTTSYIMGFALRFLLGVAAGPIQSSCLSAIATHFPPHKRGFATGIFMTSTSLGISVVNLYAPALSTSYGWQSVFLATACLPLVVLLICALAFRVSDKDLAQITQGTYNAKPSTAVQLSIKERLFYFATNKQILLLCATGLFATGTTWGVTSWTNLFMQKGAGISALDAGRVMVIYGLAAFFAKPLIGYISDNVKLPKSKTAAICLFLLAPALLIYAQTKTLSIFYITGPLLAMAAFMYSPLTNALSIELAPEGMKATGAGFVNFFNQIGSLTAPLVLGQVLEFTQSYQYALMCIAIFPLIAALCLLFIESSHETLS